MRLTGKLVSSTILLAAMTVLPTFGDEGRHLISKVFTIDGVRSCPTVTGYNRDDRPIGQWVVTKNLGTNAAPVITIKLAQDCPPECVGGVCTLPTQTGQNIDLDLNGFNLRQTGNFPVIDVVVLAGSTSEVRIHNGAIIGGTKGISVGVNARKVVLEDLTISDSSGHGVSIDAQAVVIRNVVVTDTGGAGMFVGFADEVTIEDNMVLNTHDGIDVRFTSGPAAIVNNRLSGITPGSTGGNGIILVNSSGALIAENTIRGVTGQMGIFLQNTSSSKIVGNVFGPPITQDGIRIDLNSWNNMISHNVASGMTRNGIGLSGRYNLIEGNLLTSNANGLVLDATSVNNVYRGNIARNNNGNPAVCGAGACANRTDFCNNGVGNTSQGDNFMPAIVNPQACEK